MWLSRAAAARIIAVAVESGDDERLAGGADEKGERGIDQLRLVRHVGMPLRRRVHLLLQHPLVDGADRVFRTAEDLCARALGVSEGELRDRVAHPPLDLRGPKGGLVLTLAFAPFLR